MALAVCYCRILRGGCFLSARYPCNLCVLPTGGGGGNAGCEARHYLNQNSSVKSLVGLRMNLCLLQFLIANMCLLRLLITNLCLFQLLITCVCDLSQTVLPTGGGKVLGRVEAWRRQSYGHHHKPITLFEVVSPITRFEVMSLMTLHLNPKA